MTRASDLATAFDREYLQSSRAVELDTLETTKKNSAFIVYYVVSSKYCTRTINITTVGWVLKQRFQMCHQGKEAQPKRGTASVSGRGRSDRRSTTRRGESLQVTYDVQTVRCYNSGSPRYLVRRQRRLYPIHIMDAEPPPPPTFATRKAHYYIIITVLLQLTVVMGRAAKMYTNTRLLIALSSAVRLDRGSKQ